jgi:hypothetical protein
MKAIHLCIYTRGHDHAYVFIHVKVISTATQSFGVKNTCTADDEKVIHVTALLGSTPSTHTRVLDISRAWTVGVCSLPNAPPAVSPSAALAA